ncbi:glycosyltransferase family 4 protein [Corynebacterium casei]|uniref:glycosyltransferase family 4 protein n=1 Tax=Corynebacterium casei TaxID=160386 RepID=UPI003FD13848
MKLLVICNAYPSGASLYRNGFIHRRVRGYIEEGLEVSVFYNHEPVKDAYSYQFDGVDVLVGNEGALRNLVAETDFDAFLVHFAEPSRIRPLQEIATKKPVIVWVHGFEAESWYRRWFTFLGSSKSIADAFAKREKYYKPQNAFFNELMTQSELNITFVNVSEWFQKYVVEPDNHAEFSNSVVIHNLVDEMVFPYVEKTAEQRLNILSIRPFASTKYANDQTVKAILELSKRPYFNELNFTICGAGPLFESTVAPLRKFSNVKLLGKFFSQEEIRELHKSHGVFLCPTRFDSQGVSMCEAVSSGLVAVSSNTSAIPEFIEDGKTGLLAQAEDFIGLAEQIETLYFDEEKFSFLSENGAREMIKQCGQDATIGREIQLIRSKMGSQ